ncbi:hypothetical protein [Nocardiopsis synnemataformans]|uniref:hypothetical protein n=1 Tax=Nocardiopsis synnemataformans TaxID=61305 RepID=UPI003EBFD28A
MDDLGDAYRRIAGTRGRYRAAPAPGEPLAAFVHRDNREWERAIDPGPAGSLVLDPFMRAPPHTPRGATARTGTRVSVAVDGPDAESGPSPAPGPAGCWPRP